MTGLVTDGGLTGQVLTKKTDAYSGQPEIDYDWSDGAATGLVFIGDTPPASPIAGQLWWQSDTGDLFIYYTDVDSSQWVEIATKSSGDAFVRPIVTSVEPRVAGVSDPDLVGVKVIGSGFTSTSVVYLDNTPKATKFVSATELTFDHITDDAKAFGVTVNTDGIYSLPPIRWDIIYNPLIDTLTPNTVAAGSAAFTLTVHGGQFTSYPEFPTVICFDGVPIPTDTATSQTIITATVTPPATPGTHAVTVQNGPVVSISSQTFTYT